MAQQADIILSNWHHFYDGLRASPQEIYFLIEKAINERELPGAVLSRVVYKEGGIFSARREYLRVRRKDHIFDLCAAPFGRGLFASWWLGESVGLFWRILFIIPPVALTLIRIFRPDTFYRIDTALTFQDSVHSAVMEVFDGVTKAKGLRALSESEKKPILSDLFYGEFGE